MLSTQSKNSESVTLINYVEQVSYGSNSELVTVIAHSKLTSCDSLVKTAKNQRHFVSSVCSSALRDLGLGLVLMLAMCLPMLILYALASLGPFLIRDWHIDAEWLGYATLGCFTLAALLSPFAGYLVERLGTRLALS